MKVLITPMAAMAETSGPFSRSAALCRALIESGNEAAFCAALDVNYHKIDGIRNYYCPVPSPLGLPSFIGRNVLSLVQTLGIQQRQEVSSFEQVLFFAGALNEKLFFNDVDCIRQAIRDFKPDMVYSEFRPAAIVAAKLEGVKVASGFSYPVQKAFASSPEFSLKIRKKLKEYNLPNIESILDIFEWADLRIVPSSYELEPIEGKNIVYTGPFVSAPSITENVDNKRVIAYMGSGTISPVTLIRVLTQAFENSEYEVYIATEKVKPSRKNNIIIDKRFNFAEIMPGATAYINHGGQNSIMTGLLYGIPQVICPGNVFERKYNASSIENLKAGKYIRVENFNPGDIKTVLNEFEKNKDYRENALSSGRTLLKSGGTARAVEAMCDLLHQQVI